MSEYDYVVIGGGSAGCVLAAELSADPDVSVLLLEAGSPAELHPETLSVDGYKDAFINPELMWERFSAPQPGCGGRRIFMGSGRGMGGSGSINGMVYTRGSRADYAAWPAAWHWDRIAPEFDALEAKLGVQRRDPTEFTRHSIEAAEEAGFRAKDDLNDGDLAGVIGHEWMNFSGPQRRSSYVAFLKPHLSRPNLTLVTSAQVERLQFDSNRRVSGVAYRVGTTRHLAKVRREAVLCAGALESPKLLLLSGIGPAAELRRHGIAEVCQRSEVGENLHDHPNVTLFFHGPREVDCHYPQLYSFHRANPSLSLAAEDPDSCYVFYPARSSFREGLLRMLPAMALPQALYRHQAAVRAVRGAVKGLFNLSQVQEWVARLYGIVVILGKPMSRGTLRLHRADPAALPQIDPGYFSDPQDMTTMVRGVELARRIAGSKALKEWGNREVMPGRWAHSSGRIQAFVRNNMMTTFHYAGTCAMGDHEGAVVDTELRVRGIEGLRVADASVIPTTPVSALNAPSMLIAYRLAQTLAAERRAE